MTKWQNLQKEKEKNKDSGRVKRGISGQVSPATSHASSVASVATDSAPFLDQKVIQHKKHRTSQTVWAVLEN